MAWVLAYPVAVAGTYFIGRNILFKGTSYAIDYILNSNADPDIKESHTVETIEAMLDSYKDLSKKHPAYESKRAVEESLKQLRDVVDRVRLKLSVHESGYLTRFRTFDARADNIIIEKKANELMSRLDIFTKLIKLREHVKDNEDEDNNNKKSYTYYTGGVTDEEDVMPITAMTTLAIFRPPFD